MADRSEGCHFLRHCLPADEVAGLEAPGSSSRLEQLSARLAGMSLSKSFTERRRSFPPPSVQPGEEEPSLLQRLESVAEQQLQLQQQLLDMEQPQAAATTSGAVAVTVTAQEEAAAATAEGEEGGEPSAVAAEPEGQPAEEAARRDSTSHWDEWNALLKDGAPSSAAAAAAGAAGTAAADAAAVYEQAPLSRTSSPLLQLPRTSPSGKQDAIGKLQEAPMPASLSAPAGALVEAQPHPTAPADPGAAAGTAAAATSEPGPATAASVLAGAAGMPARLASVPIASRGLSVPMPAAPPLQQLPSSASSAPLALPPAPSSLPPAPVPLQDKQPSKLMQLLGKLRSDLQPGHMPLTAGRVELSGRALLPGGADGARVAIFDDEPTSIVAYFLSTRWVLQ